jgi:Fur family ferric uptake transcriptional regulator
MHITADDLVDALRSQDLRITEPRRLVCEIIARRHGDHLTASAIYEAVSSGSSGSVDRATVYRTLDALEEAGAVRHSHFGNGPTVYHLAEEAGHHHLVCTECGRTVSVRSETIAPLIGTLEEATGFRVDIEHTALTGVCRECSVNGQRSTVHGRPTTDIGRLTDDR